MRQRLIPAALLLLSAAAGHAQRSLSVGEMFALIETNSSSMEAARSGIDAATLGLDAARAQRLPDVSAQVSGSLNGDVLMLDRDLSHAKCFTSPRWSNTLAVEARQVVYAGGAIDAGVRMARLNKEMEETNLSATRQGLRFNSLAQYLQLIQIDHALRVYDENIRLAERLIEHVRVKQAQGMALSNDITRYELQRQNLLLGRRQTEDARQVANHRLCTTLGIADERIVPDTTVVAAVYAQDDEALWQTTGAASAPEMARAHIATLMAEQQLRLAQSDLRPKVEVVAADNFSGPFQYDIPPVDKNFNVWFVGLGVKYSLSNLWKSKRKVQQARAALTQTQQQKDVVGETLNNRIQEAHTMYLQSYTLLATQQKSVLLATQNYRTVSERYRNQLALVTDMIDAANAKLAAELGEADARVNVVLTYYRLKYISGTL